VFDIKVYRQCDNDQFENKSIGLTMPSFRIAFANNAMIEDYFYFDGALL